ncbi:putative Ig domain-containing protein [Egicoccus sp. AB-alg2]|uniref:putative Ig domain-containing protein n=1 Tax=Egicoccus sp. AB-alg2 TaxID=3242693 RepID=UPI00359EE0FD
MTCRATTLVVTLTLLAAPAAAWAEPGESVPVLQNTLGDGVPVVGTDISSLGGQQYHQNNQRNVWWNEYQQRWDGILPTASPPASRSSAWWLWYGLEAETPEPVTEVEDAPARTPDAYWDADERLLYVFFSRGNSGTSNFRRFAYDPTTDRYVEQRRPGGANAPTRLRGGKRVTIIKSPNGHLWAGVNSVETREILISRSTDGGDTWPEPVRIKDTAIGGEGHWVTFTQDGRTRVGFAATEDGVAPDARVHFLHLDEDESQWADPASWTDETASLPDWEGDERADDELSAVVFEDRVFITIETEPLGDARSARRPQLIVYEREAGGGWLKHVILRYDRGINDAKRPVITVDASARLLIVSGGTTQRTHADLWYAPIDALQGRDEAWETLRVFQVTDPASENIYTTRMPLPRFPVTSQSNLPILIDDRGDALNLRRQVVSSSGGGAPPGTPNRPPVVESVTIDQDAPGTDDTLTVTVVASDPDGDELTYQHRWSRNGEQLVGETGASLDLSRPGNGDKGDAISVEVVASDGQLESAPVSSAAVTIVNTPPAFDEQLPDRTDPEGATVSLSASASDPDGDLLTYRAEGLPPGIAIDPDTGAITGTLATGAAADSPYEVAVTVSDGEADGPAPPAAISRVQSAADDLSGVNTLAVSFERTPQPGNLLVAFGHYGANRTPTIPPGWTLALETNQGAETVVFYRVAGVDEPTEVELGASGAPLFMSLSIFEYAGLHPVQSEVLDRVAFNVANDVSTVTTGLTQPTRQDDQLLLASVGLNGTRSFDDAWTDGFRRLTSERRQTVAERIVTTTGSFQTSESWSDRTVGIAVGSLLTFRGATASEAPPPAETTQTFTWTVTTTTPPTGPVIDDVTVAPAAPRTDDTLSTAVSTTGDGPLTYTYRWLRNDSPLDDETGHTLDLSRPGNGDKGDRIAVEVVASDGTTSSEPVRSAEVTVVNSPPAFDPGPQDRTDREGDDVSFATTASDPDEDELTYAAAGLPGGVSIDPATGEVAGTLAVGSAGDHDVTVTVSDGDDAAEATFRWTVTTDAAPPDAPTGLATTSTSTEVLLSWDAAAGAVGYHVLRGEAPAGPFDALTNSPVTDTTFTDVSAPPGTSYYRVTAVDAAGNESPPAETSVQDRIVLRSVSEATARDAREIRVDRPTGVAADDVLVATIAVSGAAVNAAPGWTLIREDAASGGLRQATYHRVAGDDEPSVYPFAFAAAASATGVVVAYRGVDATAPVEVDAGRANPSSTTITAPSVTTTAADRLLVGAFSVASNASNGLEPPEEMVERADVVQGQGRDKLALEVADQILPAAGASGTRSATATNRPGVNIGQLIALRPAGS